MIEYNHNEREEKEMTNYIPKYQFQAIVNKRQGKGVESFKYQKMRKDGTWGAVREGDNKYY